MHALLLVAVWIAWCVNARRLRGIIWPLLTVVLFVTLIIAAVVWR